MIGVLADDGSQSEAVREFGRVAAQVQRHARAPRDIGNGFDREVLLARRHPTRSRRLAGTPGQHFDLLGDNE